MDDWKVNSRLTLNIGLRYELPEPVHEKYGRLTNFIPGLNKLVIGSEQLLAPGVTFTNANQVETAQQAGLPQSLVNTNYKDFAPRFGLAWRPFGGSRTVVRGGYGIFYGGAGLLVNLYTALGNVFPFTITQTVNKTAVPSYLTFANPFPVPANLAGSYTTVSGFQYNQPTPYAQNWNLTIEQAVGAQSAIEIGYSGSKGTHLAKDYNLNEPYDRSPALPAGITPSPQWGTTAYFGIGYDSTYNQGSITFRRRFARNFFFRVNYIYSKSIDDGSELQGAGWLGWRRAGCDQFQAGARIRIWTSATNLPCLFPGWRRGESNVFVRGWQLSGTGIAHTGAPFYAAGK